MGTLAFFRTFGPYIAIVALIMVVLFYRGDHIKVKAQRDAAVTEATSLRKTNEQNAATMTRLSAAAEANARIAEGVATDIAAIRERGTNARVIIQEATRNDPSVRAWADTPVPSRVRDALEPARPAN